jgi:hypothetical protein
LRSIEEKKRLEKLMNWWCPLPAEGISHTAFTVSIPYLSAGMNAFPFLDAVWMPSGINR